MIHFFAWYALTIVIAYPAFGMLFAVDATSWRDYLALLLTAAIWPIVLIVVALVLLGVLGGDDTGRFQ